MNTQLTENEFYKYKTISETQSIPSSLLDFVNMIKDKEIRTQQTRNRNWKRVNSGIERNWLIAKKFSQTDTERLCSQYRSILNKINKENFQNLVDELLELDIESGYQLSLLVDVIFKKAVSESSFCELYSKLCLKLISYYIEPNDENEYKDRIYFRTFLLNKAQEHFEKCVSFKNEKELDESKSIFRTKKNILGCITFLGELYNNGILTNNIISACFTLMWLNVKQNKLYLMDSLCTLITIVGKKYHKKCPQKEKNIFNNIISLKDSVNIREKFTIMDLTTERKKWL